ncbi:hypothetical protein SAMN02787142_7295 [Burkholderia sp. WP9]|nr:hypothetical protein SAMN02787142_7295 [Burkholderia sp. WP9]
MRSGKRPGENSATDTQHTITENRAHVGGPARLSVRRHAARQRAVPNRGRLARAGGPELGSRDSPIAIQPGVMHRETASIQHTFCFSLYPAEYHGKLRGAWRRVFHRASPPRATKQNKQAGASSGAQPIHFIRSGRTPRALAERAFVDHRGGEVGVRARSRRVDPRCRRRFRRTRPRPLERLIRHCHR